VRAAYDAFDGILIIDEAYAEFSSKASAIELLAGRPRLIVSRTMSKAFAFAGARVGYLAADAAVVDALRIVRLPYHLSALTQAAARAALRHSAEMLANVEQIKVQRDRMIAQLKLMGLRAYESEANFVLVEGFENPNEVFEALLARGVIVRNVGIPNTLRITAGTEAETSKLLGELALILG
jgi:histidinol-phosphate aminotransferase